MMITSKGLAKRRRRRRVTQDGQLIPPDPAECLDAVLCHTVNQRRQRTKGGRVVGVPRESQMLSTVLKDGLWKGNRCFVIGGGPSLEDFDWSLLKGELVIGANRAFEFCDPAVIYSMDARYWRWIEKGTFGQDVTERFRDYPGYKIWLNTAANCYPEDILLVPCTGADSISESLADGLGGGGNSGYGALNLALCLGADPIYLLGYDMGHGSDKKQTWFHGGYPTIQDVNVYEGFRKPYNKFADNINQRARVINLNTDSGLRCFPFGFLEDVKMVEHPLLISYYTKGTGYEKEVIRLIRSAYRWGIEHDIEGIPSLGSWQQNTQFKAKFIKQKMEKHPDRNLLFVDADGCFCARPALLDNMEDVDIAVHYRKRGERPEGGEELLSGTLFLRNTEGARRLVDLWIKRNSERPGDWDQRTLEVVVEQNQGIKVGRLPAEYCCIYDKMAKDVPEPVIEHFQASRRLRVEVG